MSAVLSLFDDAMVQVDAIQVIAELMAIPGFPDPAESLANLLENLQQSEDARVVGAIGKSVLGVMPRLPAELIPFIMEFCLAGSSDEFWTSTLLENAINQMATIESEAATRLLHFFAQTGLSKDWLGPYVAFALKCGSEFPNLEHLVAIAVEHFGEPELFRGAACYLLMLIGTFDLGPCAEAIGDIAARIIDSDEVVQASKGRVFEIVGRLAAHFSAELLETLTALVVGQAQNLVSLHDIETIAALFGCVTRIVVVEEGPARAELQAVAFSLLGLLSRWQEVPRNAITEPLALLLQAFPREFAEASASGGDDNALFFAFESCQSAETVSDE
jgi:hypothetical protein